MTIADVAQLTGLSWDTIKEIDKSYLKDKYQSVSLAAVRYIAIDEVYLGRKRKFITIAMDLESRRVIHVGKGKDALKRLWKRLKRHNARYCQDSCAHFFILFHDLVFGLMFPCSGAPLKVPQLSDYTATSTIISCI